jgi:hypothetical protein
VAQLVHTMRTQTRSKPRWAQLETQLNESPIGTEVRVEGDTFEKVSRYGWSCGGAEVSQGDLAKKMAEEEKSSER